MHVSNFFSFPPSFTLGNLQERGKQTNNNLDNLSIGSKLPKFSYRLASSILSFLKSRKMFSQSSSLRYSPLTSLGWEGNRFHNLKGDIIILFTVCELSRAAFMALSSLGSNCPGLRQPSLVSKATSVIISSANTCMFNQMCKLRCNL
jgi:hypothetical protein